MRLHDARHDVVTVIDPLKLGYTLSRREAIHRAPHELPRPNPALDADDANAANANAAVLGLYRETRQYDMAKAARRKPHETWSPVSVRAISDPPFLDD